MKDRVTRVLLMTESIWSLGTGLFFPIFAIFSEQVGGDITDAGIAAAIFIFVTSIAEYPIGKLIDTYREKWFIVTDYALEALVFIGYIFVDNKWELFGLQIVLGFANAIGDPAWESLYDRYTPKTKTGRAWAGMHLVTGILNALGITVGVFIVAQYGFDIVFGIAAALSGIAAILAARFIEQKSRIEDMR